MVTLSFLAGCGSPTTAANPSPSGPRTSSPSPLSSQVVSASLAPGLSCRLPVLVPTSFPSSEPPGGWVTFPSGSFVRDPTSSANPVNHQPSYDWAMHRWVPVESVNVSPDGRHYVNDQQPGAIGKIDLVDAATGASRTIYTTSGYRRVVAYAPEGIYLTDTGINPSPGLWLLDPATGAVRLIPGSDQHPSWFLVGHGAAWTVVGVPGPLGSGEQLLRLDLGTAQTTTWYASQLPLGLVALDRDGHPLISLLTDPVSVALLDSPNHLQQLEFPSGVAFSGDAYATPSRVWLSLQHDEGVALFTGGRTVKVFKPQTGPYSFTVAGDCL